MFSLHEAIHTSHSGSAAARCATTPKITHLLPRAQVGDVLRYIAHLGPCQARCGAFAPKWTLKHLWNIFRDVYEQLQKCFCCGKVLSIDSKPLWLDSLWLKELVVLLVPPLPEKELPKLKFAYLDRSICSTLALSFNYSLHFDLWNSSFEIRSAKQPRYCIKDFFNKS